MGAVALLLLDVNRHPTPVSRLEVPEQTVDVHAVVPDIQLGHPGVPAHPIAVGNYGGLHRHADPTRTDPALLAGHCQTGGQALHVPLKRTGQ
jgi:hypothetical protein